MKTNRSIAVVAQVLLLLAVLAGASAVFADQNLAGNVTITGGAANGKLNVTGAIDSDSNTFTFGTQSSSYGGALLYQDSNTDTLTFSINRSPASWLWLHSSAVAAMRLDSNHQLIIYQSNGTTAGVTLTPASNQLSLGTATLTGSGTGLTAGGAFTVTGTFTNTNGSFTGGSSGLTLNAGSANQNITFTTPAGTGDIIFNTNGIERARIKSTGSVGIGTASPAAKLDVNGDLKATNAGFGRVPISSWPLVTQGLGVGVIEGTGQNAISIMPNLSGYNYVVSDYFSGSTRLPLVLSGRGTTNDLVLATNGNVGIGTASPAAKLDLQGGMMNISDVAGGAATTKAFIQGTNGVSYFGSASTQRASFGNSENWETLTVDGGNVGIGTTNPGQKLTIEGTTPIAEIRSGGYLMLRPTDNSWDMRLQAAGTRLDVLSGGAVTSPIASFLNGGNVGIGTTNPTQKLAVAGTIRAYEVIVDTGWSDYVFDQDYPLAPLSEVERHIKAEKHLPGIPSAQEVADHGVSLGEMQSRLLAKVEELTLHLIAQEKQLAAQSARIAQLEQANAALQNR